MCAQCMAAAATSGAAVTGIRAWLGARGFSWLTPRRLKRVTAALIGTGLLAAALLAS